MLAIERSKQDAEKNKPPEITGDETVEIRSQPSLDDDLYVVSIESLLPQLNLIGAPRKWGELAIKAGQRSVETCMDWISTNRELLSSHFPDQKTLDQRRKSTTVEMSKEYTSGHSAEITKRQYRKSVYGRDLTPLPLTAGWLEKKGKIKYSKRYFKLNNEYMNYYASESESKAISAQPKGSFNLKRVNRIELKKASSSSFFIILHFHTRDKTKPKRLRCSDKAMAAEWQMALTRRMEWFASIETAADSALRLRELIKGSLPDKFEPPLTLDAGLVNFDTPVLQKGSGVFVSGPALTKTADGWKNGTVFVGNMIPVNAKEPVEWTFRMEVGKNTTVGLVCIDANVNDLLNNSGLGWGYYQANGNTGNGGLAKKTVWHAIHHGWPVSKFQRVGRRGRCVGAPGPAARRAQVRAEREGSGRRLPRLLPQQNDHVLRGCQHVRARRLRVHHQVPPGGQSRERFG